MQFTCNYLLWFLQQSSLFSLRDNEPPLLLSPLFNYLYEFDSLPLNHMPPFLGDFLFLHGLIFATYPFLNGLLHASTSSCMVCSKQLPILAWFAQCNYLSLNGLSYGTKSSLAAPCIYLFLHGFPYATTSYFMACSKRLPPIVHFLQLSSLAHFP